MKVTVSSAIAQALEILRQQSNGMTLKQAITKLRYNKNPVNLPYRVTVVDLLEIMEEKRLIKVYRKRGKPLSGDTRIKVL